MESRQRGDFPAETCIGVPLILADEEDKPVGVGGRLL
jgi:hypothetical protein